MTHSTTSQLQQLDSMLLDFAQHDASVTTSSKSSNVGCLFQMAGEVGRAMGTLVTFITDDEGSGFSDEDDLAGRV